MTIVSTFALIATLFLVIVGFFALVGESGYKFDLRRGRSRRRARDGRMGGRREDDRLATARN